MNQVPLPETPKNGWSEYRRFVLEVLDGLQRDQAAARMHREKMDEHITDIRLEVRELQTRMAVRAAAWGAASGLLAALTAALIATQG